MKDTLSNESPEQSADESGSRAPTCSGLGVLMSCFDNRNTHDTESLKRLGGEFYRMGDEEWCDTAIASWRKEGADTWVRRG